MMVFGGSTSSQHMLSNFYKAKEKFVYEHIFNFNDMLTTSFNKMQHENKYLYITGDFNVSTLFHVKGGLSTQQFKNIFSSNYCFPFINNLTRVTDHSASLIDNIYSNIPSQNCFSISVYQNQYIRPLWYILH